MPMGMGVGGCNFPTHMQNWVLHTWTHATEMRRGLYKQFYFSLCYISEVHLDPQRTWCPAADCQTVCHIALSESGALVPVECPACHLTFCSSCKEAWHPQRLCQENQTTPVPTEQG